MCDMDTLITALGGQSLSDCGSCVCLSVADIHNATTYGCHCSYETQGEYGPETNSCTIPPAGPCLQTGEEEGTVLDQEFSDKLVRNGRGGLENNPGPNGPRAIPKLNPAQPNHSHERPAEPRCSRQRGRCSTPSYAPSPTAVSLAHGDTAILYCR
jgi:hypothetical protein